MAQYMRVMVLYNNDEMCQSHSLTKYIGILQQNIHVGSHVCKNMEKEIKTAEIVG